MTLEGDERMSEMITSAQRARTACFTGHRRIPKELEDEILRAVKRVIVSLYNEGYRHFVAGGALGFDTIAARAVLAAKGYYGDVTLELCLPCRNQTEKWNESDRELYEFIKLQADEVKYIHDCYTSGCMQERNRAMVDKSSYCIAYMIEQSGGTAYTVKYANGKGLRMCNVADMI